MQVLLRNITLLGVTLIWSVMCYNVRNEALEQNGLCIHAIIHACSALSIYFHKDIVSHDMNQQQAPCTHAAAHAVTRREMLV